MPSHPARRPTRPPAATAFLTLALLIGACTTDGTPPGADGEAASSPTVRESTRQRSGGQYPSTATPAGARSPLVISGSVDGAETGGTPNARSGSQGAAGSDQTDGDGTDVGADQSDGVVAEAPMGGPDEIIEQLTSDLAADGLDGGETLDAVDPLDDKPNPTSARSLRDGLRLNESGERNVFDEEANLACADAEIALTALDEGRLDDAADHLISASDRAGRSGVDRLNEWGPVLSRLEVDRNRPATGRVVQTDDVATLLAFLSVCTTGGYEL